MIGLLATSLRGHDKAKIYVIVGRDAEYVYLCDGKYRPLANPKRKNQKHIQIIRKNTQASFVKKRQKQGRLRDEDVKRIIKEYISKS